MRIEGKSDSRHDNPDLPLQRNIQNKEKEKEKNILDAGLATTVLSLLELGLEEGDAVVEGDGLLLLGRDLGLGGSKVTLGVLSAGKGGISLSADRGNFLKGHK